MEFACIIPEAAAEFAVFHQRVQAGANIPANYAGRPELLPLFAQQSVAIVPIRGMIGKELSMEYYGGTSLDLLMARLNTLVADPKVSHIILDINSPGGYVTGVENAARAIYELAQKKPIIAYTSTLCASAAYWIASACSAIYTEGETTRVGSLGVYAATAHYTKMLEKAGIDVHEFTTGKYKALGSPYHTPSDDEKAKLQDMVDTLFTVFIDNVAEFRDVPKDTLLKSADGQVFFSTDAAARQLTDGAKTVKEILMTTEQEQKAKAEAEAAVKRAAELEAANKLLQDQLKAATDKEAAQAKAAAEAECDGLYKAHLGRDATAEEKATYAASSADVRAMLKGTLEAASKQREALGSKLTGEQAPGPQGKQELSAESKEANLIVAALGSR